MNNTSAAQGGGSPPWSERDLDQLQALLDSVPAPLEPLDVSMLDGFLCGVLLQPRPLPPKKWWPYVMDGQGRLPPGTFDTRELEQLVGRRHSELNRAIDQRSWFDPWVFELHDESSQEHPSEDESGDHAPVVDALHPWVAGFAAACEVFPELMELDESKTTEPLALIYQHFDANDLEDADALLAEIETLEPPEDLTEAVEQLVRATLLLADVSRPVKSPAAGSSRRAAPPRPRNKAPRR